MGRLLGAALAFVAVVGLIPSAAAEPPADACSPAEVKRAMTQAQASTKDASARTEAVRTAFRTRLESCVMARLEWVKTSPVDDPATWSLARRDATAYLQTLFAGGVLSGTTPSQAYKVVCDHTTMVGEHLAPDQLRVILAAAITRPGELEQTQLTIRSSAH